MSEISTLYREQKFEIIWELRLGFSKLLASLLGNDNEIKVFDESEA